MAADYQLGAALWFQSSGWAATLNGLVGGQRAPEAKGQERQAERDARVSRIQIYPGDVDTAQGERVHFTAVAYDRDGAPVAGEVRRMTEGRGVQVVYDSVGKTTFMKSLDSLAPRWLLALFGQSSGSVPPLTRRCWRKKALYYMTRPSLAQYALTREELLWHVGDVLNWITAGELKLRIEKTFPLSEVVEAHSQLEGRATTGKILLLP